MIETNPLQPLADALLATRMPCPACFAPHMAQNPERPCPVCDGLGSIWPAPLDWLASQVLEQGSYESGRAFWVPRDPVALHWPKGWAYGMGRYWLESMLPPHCNTDWAGRLGMMLDDPLDTDRNLAALVEAVPHA